LILISLALLVNGCVAVGPEYEKPTVDTELAWLEAQQQGISEQAATDPQWWKTAFVDPVLDELVATALAENLTLRSAGLRILQAQQNLAIAVGKQYPQSQVLSGSADFKQISKNSSDHIPLLDHNFTTFGLGFNLNWEADFFGRFKRMIQTASAQLDASVAGYDEVMVSMIAGVAQNYLLIRTYQQRLSYARDNVNVQQESLTISQARYEGGMVTELDVDQAQTLLSNTQATVYALETALQQFKNNLAVLLGQSPQHMSALLGTAAPVPSVPAQIALGMPQDLIRRRPDIRVAERQLAAQSAQIGFAITELYPSFTLGGNIGTSTNNTNGKNIGDMFDSDSLTGNIFGAFSWNIFNYGRIKSNVRLQDAVFQQLLVDYRNLVLQAQGEVENAIVAYLNSQQQLNAYRVAAVAAQRAVGVAQVQYEDGLITYDRVIQTLLALEGQQDLLASTEGAVATNLVQVYKTLGGGWEIRSSADASDLLPTATKDQMRTRIKYWDGMLD